LALNSQLYPTPSCVRRVELVEPRLRVAPDVHERLVTEVLGAPERVPTPRERCGDRSRIDDGLRADVPTGCRRRGGSRTLCLPLLGRPPGRGERTRAHTVADVRRIAGVCGVAGQRSRRRARIG